jgi:hypothetical protein
MECPKKISHNGECLTISEWALRLGISRQAFDNRLKLSPSADVFTVGKKSKFYIKKNKHNVCIFRQFAREMRQRPPRSVIVEFDSLLEDKRKALCLSLKGMALSVRAANALNIKDKRMIFVYQLVKYTPAEILSWKNVGKKTLKEFEEIVADLGLSLGMIVRGLPPFDDLLRVWIDDMDDDRAERWYNFFKTVVQTDNAIGGKE